MNALLLLLATTVVTPLQPVARDTARWEAEARNVTIIRDDWGIAHVYGKTDADAVFGMEYAQAEDDFNRIETNYLNAMGRLAEAEGESAIYQDLRMKLFIDPDSMQALYRASPAWLREADGRVRRRSELLPLQASRREAARHHALRAVDGAHIHRGEHRRRHRAGEPERAARRSTAPIRRGSAPRGLADGEDPAFEPGGSNGIAIAPAITLDHHALLWINPHTSFYFRSELQMVSEEGLDAYGAVTWGQFFVYQGFNRYRGLDAHLERRGQHRRVSGNGREEGRPCVLPLR